MKIQNFESWRKAKQAAVAPSGAAHFHLVEDNVYLHVSNLLMSICASAVCSRAMILQNVSDNTLNAIMLFVDQMRDAYIHPRSTSHRFRFASEGLLSANSNTLKT